MNRKLILFLTLTSLLFSSCSAEKDSNALTEQSLENIIAFTKLYGYVRYFHPSSEAQKIDWDKFAIYGMGQVEPANNTNELKDILKYLFLPIAPTLKIYNKNNYKEDDLKIFSPENTDRLKEVIWKHHGFIELENNPTIYKLIAENKPDSVFKNLPIKEKIFRTEIGAGLNIIMPIVLYSDSIGTLPRGDTDKIKKLIKYADDSKFEYNSINRFVRFADVAIAWNILQHFYPYFDVIETDWKAELPVALKEASTDTSNVDFLLTLKRFTSKLNDGHNEIIYAKSDNNNSYPGLRWEVIENQVVITQVTDDDTNNIKRGDVIISINGINSMELLASYDSLVSGTTQWKRVDNHNLINTATRKSSLEMLASGKENSILKLKVLHADKTTNNVELVRNHNSYQYEKKYDVIFELTDGIYYIDMTRCTLEDYSLNRSKLVKAKGIIYDCRGFPKMFDAYISDMSGDSVTAAFKMYTSILLYPDQLNLTYDIFPPLILQGNEKYFKAPKVVITNSRAISGAESLILTIQHNHLATIVGEHTAGADGVMNGFTLPGGYKVIFTGLRLLNYDGSQFYGIGVIPDIPVSKTIKGVSEGKDELLEKAIGILNKKIK